MLKAQREFKQACESARKDLQQTEAQCLSLMNEICSNTSDRDQYGCELRIMGTRLKCVHLVLNGPVVELQMFIQSFSEAKDAKDGPAATGSRDSR